MTDPTTIPVTGLLHDFGERWQIEAHGTVWTAVQRPTPTQLRVIVAYPAAELAAKLATAEDA